MCSLQWKTAQVTGMPGLRIHWEYVGMGLKSNFMFLLISIWLWSFYILSQRLRRGLFKTQNAQRHHSGELYAGESKLCVGDGARRHSYHKKTQPWARFIPFQASGSNKMDQKAMYWVMVKYRGISLSCSVDVGCFWDTRRCVLSPLSS